MCQLRGLGCVSVERTGVCVSREDRGVCRLRGLGCVCVSRED